MDFDDLWSTPQCNFLCKNDSEPGWLDAESVASRQTLPHTSSCALFSDGAAGDCYSPVCASCCGALHAPAAEQQQSLSTADSRTAAERHTVADERRRSERMQDDPSARSKNNREPMEQTPLHSFTMNNIEPQTEDDLPEIETKNGLQFGEDVDFCKCQRECPELSPLIRYMEEGVLPEGDDEKLRRKILTEAACHYFNSKGELCRGRRPKRKEHRADDLFDDDEIRVVPEALRQEVLEGYHQYNHSGINRLGANVMRRFFWTSLYKDVKRFVAECEVCAKSKSYNPPRANLGETVEVTFTESSIKIDLVTGLNASSNGSLYILTVICNYSRMLWLHPLASQTSQSIADKLLVTISQASMPKAIFQI